MITEDVARSIEASVLCWLATVSDEGVPNVSPKEAFLHDGDGRLLVAHIASPQTIRNIQHEPRVCVSFVDVFTQKGHKINGVARILGESDDRYQEQKDRLTAFIGETFPILAVIEIQPTQVEEIIAPSYLMHDNVSEQEMIRQSLKTYRVAERQGHT